jgi:hypothetical protein
MDVQPDKETPAKVMVETLLPVLTPNNGFCEIQNEATNISDGGQLSPTSPGTELMNFLLNMPLLWSEDDDIPGENACISFISKFLQTLACRSNTTSRAFDRRLFKTSETDIRLHRNID